MGPLFVGHRLHVDEIDQTGKRLTRTDWKLNGDEIAAQALAQHIENVVEIRAVPIHFVDESDPRNAITVSLPPHRF